MSDNSNIIIKNEKEYENMVCYLLTWGHQFKTTLVLLENGDCDYYEIEVINER